MEDDNAVKSEQSSQVKEEAPVGVSTSTTATSTSGAGTENFVVLDMAGDSEDSDKEDKVGGKESKEKEAKASGSDENNKTSVADPSAKTTATNPRLRRKPKAPIVDVTSLRKRKWQLKVYPLHADDLQLNYVSILCKLASESLLYIPSESRHGKAELYVATQKETAAIIGKLLRMGFHHRLLSIEVVRKDTGGKEDGDESKKECKAFLMFDKFLSKKIFDAKGEKGTLVEKLVTLNKLPKAATKDFIGALFPFATEIEIFENSNPDERKATVKCKTPVTSLLVYKSFKRLEINDVHVKLTVDDSVKAIILPPMFFVPPPEKKDPGPPESIASLNQSSLPRRPLLTPLNRRVQQIKKRALLSKKRPMRGPLLQSQRPGQMSEVMAEAPSRPGDRRSMTRRSGERRYPQEVPKNRGPGTRDYPGGPGRRKFNERQIERRNRDRSSVERTRRRSDREESQVTKEMLQLQNQLNQAIKNQIAMLSTAQPGGGAVAAGPMRAGPQGGGSSLYPMAGSHRTGLLGHGPRHFGSGSAAIGPTVRGMEQPEFGNSWPSERGGRMDRGERGERGMERDRLGGRHDRMERQSRTDRPVERNDRMDRNARMEGRPDRIDRSERDRGDRSGGGDLPHSSRSQRQAQAFGGDSGRNKADRGHSGTSGLNSSHGSESSRGTARAGRGSEYSTTGRSSQRNEGSYSANSHGQNANSGRYGDYNSQGEGESASYYRRY